MVLLALWCACLAEEEQEIKALERTKRGQEPDWAVILNNTMSSPLVIVDAYNIIYQWPRLKKWMNKGMMHKAREYLIHDLEELQYMKGWRIECVFDGAGRSTVGPLGDGPGGSSQRDKVSKPDQMSSKKVTGHGVRVVYSGVGSSADSYIEERCFAAKNITKGETTGSLIVASNDGAIRTIASSAGALCMSSDRFVDELKAARKATLYRIEVAISKHTGQAMRPSKFHGKAGAPTAFRNKLIIEDKRKNNASHNGEQSIDIIESIKRKSTPPTMFRNSFVVVDKRNKSKKSSNAEDEKPKDIAPRVQNEPEEQVHEEKVDGQNESS
jgi:predicted RNA-binding protein with PIN domain